jgi:myo-inositol-1(or 4)-monophosphatase
MPDKKFTNYRLYYNFLNSLAKDLTRYYYKKLNKPFKAINKSRGKGYDPVTKADRAFEKFIRSKIQKKFPNHEIIGEEFGHKKTKSDFTWVIDPIDGTRSFVIGNPTWSNLIALNYKGNPMVGLANFPKLNKYYFNTSKNNAYVVDNGKKRKLSVNKKATFKTAKVAGAFHGWLSLKKQSKIPKVLKLMQFPCFDALSYAHFCEGKIDAVMQCQNKIWDVHALIPIISAAGGIASTWNNKDAKYAGNVLFSANKSIHKKILKLLKPALK